MSKANLSVIADVWNLMSEYVNPEDRTQLADNITVILMEHDYDLEDIRHEFDGDKDILDAVKFYSEDASDDYELDEDYSDLNFGSDDDDYDE